MKSPAANSGYIQVGGTVVMQSDEVFAYFRAGLTGWWFFFAALIYSRGTLWLILKQQHDTNDKYSTRRHTYR